jgi:hypothetical protein
MAPTLASSGMTVNRRSILSTARSSRLLRHPTISSIRVTTLMADDERCSISRRHSRACSMPRLASTRTSLSIRIKDVPLLSPVTSAAASNPRGAVLHVFAVAPHTDEWFLVERWQRGLAGRPAGMRACTKECHKVSHFALVFRRQCLEVLPDSFLVHAASVVARPWLVNARSAPMLRQRGWSSCRRRVNDVRQRR